MLKVYGTMLCKDCVECLGDLDRSRIPYEFLDITKDLAHMKAFLALRDRDALFDSVRENGCIGIPCIVDEHGNVHLSWDSYVSQA